ncbi:hypothetical protein LA080_003164 [Diaporthe eres]|nr:hypothetical protein LA080_003164 [Diaporthe eres]
MPTSVPKQGGSNTTTGGSSTTQGGSTTNQGAVVSAMADVCQKCLNKIPCGGCGSSGSSAGQGEDYIRDYKTPMKK